MIVSIVIPSLLLSVSIYLKWDIIILSDTVSFDIVNLTLYYLSTIYNYTTHSTNPFALYLVESPERDIPDLHTVEYIQ